MDKFIYGQIYIFSHENPYVKDKKIKIKKVKKQFIVLLILR